MSDPGLGHLGRRQAIGGDVSLAGFVGMPLWFWNQVRPGEIGEGTAEERAMLASGDAKDQAKLMFEAAGGNVIMDFEQPGAGGSAIHEMGGAHDRLNLFVTVRAAMSYSACQNPSLTYMALTARACGAAVGMLKEGAL